MRDIRHAFRMIVVMLALALALPVLADPPAQNRSPAIDIGYALPDRCEAFSPDGRYVAVRNVGLVEIATGEVLPVSGLQRERFAFDPNGEYVVVSGAGVYDLTRGEWRYNLEIANTPMTSSSGAYFSMGFNGVFDAETGTRLFDITGLTSFAPDDSWVLVGGEGVYSLPDGELLFAVDGFWPQADPTGRYVAVDGDGVYDVATGARLFPIADGFPRFSADGTRLLVGGDAVYSVPEGTRLLEVGGQFAEISADGRYVAIDYDGVFAIDSSERVVTLEGGFPEFLPGRDIVVAGGDGFYDIATGKRINVVHGALDNYTILSTGSEVVALNQRTEGSDGQVNYGCILYGPPDYPWPYRSGQVATPERVTLYDAPDGAVQVRDLPVFAPLPVLSVSADGQWYAVYHADVAGPIGWVRAAEVEVLVMPEGVRITEP